MAQALDPHLAEVLKVVEDRRRTLGELEEKYKKPEKPLIPLESNWMSKKLLPNLSSAKPPPPRSFRNDLHELVRLKLVKRELVRFLDGPLDGDTEVFWLASPPNP